MIMIRSVVCLLALVIIQSCSGSGLGKQSMEVQSGDETTNGKFCYWKPLDCVFVTWTNYFFVIQVDLSRDIREVNHTKYITFIINMCTYCLKNNMNKPFCKLCNAQIDKLKPFYRKDTSRFWHLRAGWILNQNLIVFFLTINNTWYLRKKIEIIK